MSPALKGLLVTLVLAIAFVGAGYGLKIYFDSKSPDYTKDFLTQMEESGAPDFSLPLVNEGVYSLYESKGNITIVNFWATWCAPCVEEFPSMLKLLEKYPDDIKIIAVSVDESKDDIINFLKAFSVNHPNLIVVRDIDRSLAEQWGTIKLPESYILDRDLKLVKKVAMSEDWANPLVFKFFDELLAEEEDAASENQGDTGPNLETTNEG